jgi:hypothetical protein
MFWVWFNWVEDEMRGWEWWECDVDLIEIGMELIEAWVDLAEDWAELAEDWAEIAEDWAELAEDWAELAADWAELAEVWAELAEVWVKLARVWAELAEVWVKLARVWAELFEDWAELAVVSSNPKWIRTLIELQVNFSDFLLQFFFNFTPETHKTVPKNPRKSDNVDSNTKSHCPKTHKNLPTCHNLLSR